MKLSHYAVYSSVNCTQVTVVVNDLEDGLRRAILDRNDKLMQYFGRAIGSVANTWNSLNPATLSGAIDVIVVEQESGDLACSPFHIRFGKFSLLRPSEKKVLFKVNGEKVDYNMKVGEGGEAFFVFETEDDIPKEMQTSPVISPLSSPGSLMMDKNIGDGLQEMEFLDLNSTSGINASDPTLHRRSQSEEPEDLIERPKSAGWPPFQPATFSTSAPTDDSPIHQQTRPHIRSQSPPISTAEALERATSISKKLVSRDIPAKVTEKGNVYLDMTGYKSEADDSADTEAMARKILAEEIHQSDNLENLIGADHQGNLWIYASEEAKEDAARKNFVETQSDFDYQSDDMKSDKNASLSTPPSTPPNPYTRSHMVDPSRTYAKTLRLTSDQLKALKLKYGRNEISFSVNDNKSTCQARMFFWRHDNPVVISDIDGTITKSDALGHVLTMIGRDWTHAGVAKLYTDIANNGYFILYLTSRSVGQADATRTYLKGIEQNRYHLPDGPVIMSPDRTMAALRREMYLKKPQVFKMSSLRDIQHLFGEKMLPFYAGFGNRITDALSYRSVGVPSSRIFTINSNAEVRLELLELTGYKSSYMHIGDLVDHFFPPVAMHMVNDNFTDFLYWREPIRDLEEQEQPHDDKKADSPDDETSQFSEDGQEDEDGEYDEDEDVGFV